MDGPRATSLGAGGSPQRAFRIRAVPASPVPGDSKVGRSPLEVGVMGSGGWLVRHPVPIGARVVQASTAPRGVVVRNWDGGPEVTAPSHDPGPATSVRLRPPVSPSSVLRRDRLLRRLEQHPGAVTFVSAHAGAGKTTLVADWATTRMADGGLVASYGFDRFDDDPARLWEGILAALRATEAFPERSALHDDLVATPHEVTEVFVERVAEAVASLATPLSLVLDDVHVVTNPAVVGSLARLARAASERLHLVLISRSDSPIGLLRLRVEGRVRELHSEDLAFTAEETATYLATQGLHLPSAGVHTLQERTRGRAAGVRIAALAMAASDDPRGLVDRFGGDEPPGLSSRERS
ncbi:MAG: hypothetical protein EA340_06410 [Nitriliruptor sp.]|nr:MAG: hypothetical protein EA340_06410 [Nitriliruptor sp.]